MEKVSSLKAKSMAGRGGREEARIIDPALVTTTSPDEKDRPRSFAKRKNFPLSTARG